MADFESIEEMVGTREAAAVATESGGTVATEAGGTVATESGGTVATESGGTVAGRGQPATRRWRWLVTRRRRPVG